MFSLKDSTAVSYTQSIIFGNIRVQHQHSLPFILNYDAYVPCAPLHYRTAQLFFVEL